MALTIFCLLCLGFSIVFQIIYYISVRKEINMISKEESEKAFQDPQIGDEFTEMFNFFVVVVDRKGKYVTTITSDKEVKMQTIDEFDKRFRYSTQDGHWIRLYKRNVDVSKWWKS